MDELQCQIIEEPGTFHLLLPSCLPACLPLTFLMGDVMILNLRREREREKHQYKMVHEKQMKPDCQCWFSHAFQLLPPLFLPSVEHHHHQHPRHNMTDFSLLSSLRQPDTPESERGKRCFMTVTSWEVHHHHLLFIHSISLSISLSIPWLFSHNNDSRKRESYSVHRNIY